MYCIAAFRLYDIPPVSKLNLKRLRQENLGDTLLRLRFSNFVFALLHPLHCPFDAEVITVEIGPPQSEFLTGAQCRQHKNFQNQVIFASEGVESFAKFVASEIALICFPGLPKFQLACRILNEVLFYGFIQGRLHVYLHLLRYGFGHLAATSYKCFCNSNRFSSPSFLSPKTEMKCFVITDSTAERVASDHRPFLSSLL